MAKKTKKAQPVYDVQSNITPAGVVKRVLDEYFQADNLAGWFLGSIVLVSLFLISQTYIKQDVPLPIFSIFSFNDLLKYLVLAFLVFMLAETIARSVFYPLIRLFISTLSTLFKPFANLITKIPSTHFEQDWVADPQPIRISAQTLIYPQMRRHISVEIKEFDYLRFDISIMGNFDHWRAGMFILGNSTNFDNVIHLYKNENDPQLRSKMTKRDFGSGRHVAESDKNLFVKNNNYFQFEVKMVSKNYYALKVNGEEVDRYKILQSEFKSIDIGAWADDRPYKIKFTNIRYRALASK